MRITAVKLAVFLSCNCIWSQSGPKPELDWSAIQKKMDVLESAVQSRDIGASQKASQELWYVTTEQKIKQSPTPADRLAIAEARRRPGDTALLPYIAMQAFQAGQLEKAELYASWTLQTPSDAYDSIHSGNIVLGLVALARNDDIPDARRFLLAAATAKGSTSLDRWGPNLALAKALLDRGQKEVVLEYFKSCHRFVTKNSKLDDWIAMLQGGRLPDLSQEFLWFQ